MEKSQMYNCTHFVGRNVLPVVYNKQNKINKQKNDYN